MVPKREQQRMRRLLSEAINVLCKASLPFKAKFTVEGLLGITLDDEEILLINVDEVVELPGETSHTTANEKSSTSTSVSSEFEQPSRPSSTLSNAATVPAQSPTLLKRANTDNDHGFPSKRHRPRGSSMADSIVIKEEPGSDSEDSNSAQTNANDIPTKPISRIFTSKSRTSSTPIKKEKIDKPNQNCDQPSNASSQGFRVGELSFSSEMSLSEVTSMEMAGGDGAEWSADAWASNSQSQLGPSMSQPVAIGSIKMEHPTQPDPGGSNQDEMSLVDTRGTDQGDSWCQPLETESAPVPTVLDAHYLEMVASGFPSDRMRIPCCPICGLDCGDYVEFNEHMKAAHNNPQHWCEVCYKGFDTMPKLRTHARQHERRYACAICGRKFGQKGDLHNHTRTHTGEKPYGCQFCEKRFKSPAHRSWHVRKLHKDLLRFPSDEQASGGLKHLNETVQQLPVPSLQADTSGLSHVQPWDVESFEATQDNKTGLQSTFLTGNTFQNYVDQHQPAAQYSDEDSYVDVNQGCVSSASLYDSAHEAGPLRGCPQRRFVCDVCQRPFKQRAHLKTHMRRHTGEEPYKCPLCDRRFKSHAHRKQHMRSQHNIDAANYLSYIHDTSC